MQRKHFPFIVYKVFIIFVSIIYLSNCNVLFVKRKNVKTKFILNFSKPVVYDLQLNLTGFYNISGTKEKILIDIQTRMKVSRIETLRNSLNHSVLTKKSKLTNLPVLKIEFSDYQVEGDIGSVFPVSLIELYLQRDLQIDSSKLLREIRNKKRTGNTNKLLISLFSFLQKPLLQEIENTNKYSIKKKGVFLSVVHSKDYQYDGLWDLQNNLLVQFSGAASGNAKSEINFIYNPGSQTIDKIDLDFKMDYKGKFFNSGNRALSDFLHLEGELEMEIAND